MKLKNVPQKTKFHPEFPRIRLIVTCKVFILVMTVVEKTLGTGQTGHALDTLLHHVRSVLTRPRSILTLNTTCRAGNFVFISIYLPERKVHGNARIVLAIILLVVVSDLSCISCFSFLSLSSCSKLVRAASVCRRGARWIPQTSGQS